MEPNFWTGLEKSQEGPFGVANQFIGDIEKKKAYKLELAMKSAIIEQEMMAKQKQFELEQSLSEPFKKKYSEQLGIPIETVREGQLANTGYRAQMAANAKAKRTRVMKISSGNSQYLIRLDEDGNEIGRQSYGLNPQFAMAAAKVDADFGSADPILDKLHVAVDKFNTRKDFYKSYPAGLATKLDTLVQNGDPDALALMEQREAFSMWLTAMVSGKQMTEREQKAMEKMLPQLTDTVSYAESKLKTLNSMVNGKREAAYRAFTGSPAPKHDPRKEATDNVGKVNSIRQNLLRLQQEQAAKNSPKGQ